VNQSRTLSPSPAHSQYSEAWQRELFSHAPEYGAEFLGTAFLMFCVVGAVAWMFAPGSPIVSALPSTRLRLFLTGLMLGAAGSFVAITPLGRVSGAHLNPAMSLGFFFAGMMHFHDLLGYIIAQSCGAALGAWGGGEVFARFAPAVRDALNQPGQQVSPLMGLAAEIAATFALAAVVFAMVSRRSLMRWVPLAVIGVVGVIVLLDGNFSGASLNPARSFGPALVMGDWHLYWVYVLGPCGGTVTAVLLHRFGTRLEAQTGKLFHDFRYRSIFTGAADHAANEQLRRSSPGMPHDRPPVRNRTRDGDFPQSI
jgi:aquaporin Z